MVYRRRVTGVETELYLQAVGGRYLPQQTLDATGQPLARGRRQRTQGDVEFGSFRDYVAGSTRLDAPHCRHHRIEHVEAPGDQGLDGLHHLAGGRDGVEGIVRHRAVAAAAEDTGSDRVRPGKDRPAATSNHPRWQFGRHVQGKSRQRRAACRQQTLSQHRLRPTRAFLARLEHEAHAASELVTMFVQQVYGARQHGGVGIVATGVHAPGYRRGKLEASLLDQRQCIHVTAQQHGRARPGTVQGSHDAAGGFGQCDVEFKARECFQYCFAGAW